MMPDARSGDIASAASSRGSRARTVEVDVVTRRVLALIDERYAEPLTLAEVAKRVHRSPAHLTTHHRKQTGRAVIDCLIQRRVDVAKSLLATTELSVAEVGERVGYPEPSVFSRRFRRSEGVSPRQWRERQRGAPKDRSFPATVAGATLRIDS
jgi:AraC-like DNA-binding protein